MQDEEEEVISVSELVSSSEQGSGDENDASYAAAAKDPAKAEKDNEGSVAKSEKSITDVSIKQGSEVAESSSNSSNSTSSAVKSAKSTKDEPAKDSGNNTAPAVYPILKKDSYTFGPFTEDFRFISEKDMFSGGGYLLTEEQALNLLLYRCKVRRHAIYHEMTLARKLRTFLMFFKDMDVEIKEALAVPIDERSISTPAQWAMSVNDLKKCTDPSHEDVYGAYISHCSINGVSAKNPKVYEQERAARQAEGILCPFDYDTWWVMRIRQVDEWDLTPPQLLQLKSLEGVPRANKLKAMVLQLKKELMDLYNAGRYAAIETRITWFLIH